MVEIESKVRFGVQMTARRKKEKTEDDVGDLR